MMYLSLAMERRQIPLVFAQGLGAAVYTEMPTLPLTRFRVFVSIKTPPVVGQWGEECIYFSNRKSRKRACIIYRSTCLSAYDNLGFVFTTIDNSCAAFTREIRIHNFFLFTFVVSDQKVNWPFAALAKIQRQIDRIKMVSCSFVNVFTWD